MSQTTANMPALEWFFRKPSASNFPQDTSSPALRQLSAAVKRLSTALQGVPAKLAELSNHALFFGAWVARVDVLAEIQKADIDDLINEVNEVASLTKKLDRSKIPQDVTESLNATVIALVILAKASHDIEFRKKIISLAKNLKQADPLPEAEVIAVSLDPIIQEFPLDARG